MCERSYSPLQPRTRKCWFIIGIRFHIMLQIIKGNVQSRLSWTILRFLLDWPGTIRDRYPPWGCHVIASSSYSGIGPRRDSVLVCHDLCLGTITALVPFQDERGQLRFAKTPVCSLLSFKTYYFAAHHVIHVTVELWPMDLVLIRDKSSN